MFPQISRCPAAGGAPVPGKTCSLLTLTVSPLLDSRLDSSPLPCFHENHNGFRSPNNTRETTGPS